MANGARVSWFGKLHGSLALCFGDNTRTSNLRPLKAKEGVVTPASGPASMLEPATIRKVPPKRIMPSCVPSSYIGGPSGSIWQWMDKISTVC